jgi:PleD family two-component response regulator
LIRRGGEEIAEEGFPSGGEDFIISQPIDNNELLARVKSLLGD